MLIVSQDFGSLRYLVFWQDMWQDSTTIFTVIELNIRIRGNIFHIYIDQYHGKILHLSTLMVV